MQNYPYSLKPSAQVTIECDGITDVWSGELFNMWVESGGIERSIADRRSICWSFYTNEKVPEPTEIDDHG